MSAPRCPKRPILCLVVMFGLAAIDGCGSSGADADGGAVCQTPSGQAQDWEPPDGGQQSDGGGPFGTPDGGLPPLGDGGMAQLDGGTDGGGGMQDDSLGFDPAGTNLTFFYKQFEQQIAEPDAFSSIEVPYPNTNGRACESCHDPHQGWQIDAARVSDAFYNGASMSNSGDPGAPPNSLATSNDQLGPLFRAIDAAIRPDADVSTPEARVVAYDLLLRKGLIRVGLPMPNGAEFSLAAIDDPYHYASANELSLYRRSLAMMNVRFLTTVMWDGRQTLPCQTLFSDLASQADDANRTHAQAQDPLTDYQKRMIVDHERIIYFAQKADNVAGPLDEDGALGGPMNLQKQTFYFGINAFPGPDPNGVAFTSKAFTLFDAWASLSGTDTQTAARQAIARGQEIFNTRTFTIANVKGFNDDLGMASVKGTCTTCHNTPNVGNNSLGLLMDIGVSDASRQTPDMPLYTFKNNATGETIQVTDPGRGLITGEWKDIGRFKVPTLRGLPAIAPYFHDGSAATVKDVINFLDARFSIGLTDSEKSDLVAFLNAL
jgi:cytochrome c peroxidase